MKRRQFLSAAAAATFCSHQLAAAGKAQGQFAGKIRKAVKYHMVGENLPPADKLKLLRDLGFDGVETRSMLKPEQKADFKKLIAARESVDFPIHGIVNSSNPDIAAAIDQAKAVGANSVLHVVRYDRSISYLQNYQETQQIIRKAIAHAEKNEVSILIENVWASYLIEPLGMAKFVDEIDSPWVQVYFDIGNVVRWGWPQHWIEVLGSRIRKLDVKEYDLQIAMNEGMRHGFRKPIGDGSIEWDKVRAELAKLKFEGWATAEVRGGDRAVLADIAKRMDTVLDLT